MKKLFLIISICYNFLAFGAEQPSQASQGSVIVPEFIRDSKTTEKMVSKYISNWNEKFDALVTFALEKGHLKVPYHFHMPERGKGFYRLGRWIAAQRTAYRNAQILASGKDAKSTHRLRVWQYKKLASIGFDFEPLKTQKRLRQEGKNKSRKRKVPGKALQDSPKKNRRPSPTAPLLKEDELIKAAKEAISRLQRQIELTQLEIETTRLANTLLAKEQGLRVENCSLSFLHSEIERIKRELMRRKQVNNFNTPELSADSLRAANLLGSLQGLIR